MALTAGILPPTSEGCTQTERGVIRSSSFGKRLKELDFLNEMVAQAQKEYHCSLQR